MIGTRPEAIKMAPVAHALAARGGRPTLVLTGQHPQLRLEEFGLEGFAAARLDCPGEQDPHVHVQRVSTALLPLLSERPDLLIVQGDTSSALGGALAGFMARIPVAHVEAGLRTHDPALPWPEEEYRTAIDAHAELLFAPTETAAANLRAEAVPGQIFVTGNTGIDALLAVQSRLPPPTLNDGGIPRLLVTCHRRESWGRGIQSIAEGLRQIARDGAARVDIVLHPNPQVADTIREHIGGQAGIRLLPPASHAGLVRLIRDSDLVLSDSGGVQEEAPALGTPLLVLREKTERPEAIASGNARLVGTSADSIVAETRCLLEHPFERLAMARPSFPFGDGRAAPRIAAIIDQWLGAKTNLNHGNRGGTRLE